MRSLLSLVFVAVLCCCSANWAQDDLTDIKGKVTLPAKYKSAIAFAELPVQLFEQLELDPPPLPENWGKMTFEEQDKWFSEFQASQVGIEWIDARQKKIDAAHVFKVRIEDDGSFIVYDVPAGTYGIGGRVDKKLGDYTVAFEVFGQLEVVANTDEILMGAIEISVTPLLQNGDLAPPLDLKTLDNKNFKLSELHGHPVVLLFWSADSPPSTALVKNIDEAIKQIGPERNLSFVTIALDEEVAKAKTFLDENSVAGISALAGGWNSEATMSYGVRGIPSLWLIDSEGKISLSNNEFSMALRLSQLSFADIIANQVDGKPIPNYPPPPVEPPSSEGSIDKDGGK
jgi:peroxiredoxin